MWCEVDLPAMDDIEPAPPPPLPEPWQPMETCPRNAVGRAARVVWVRYEDDEDPDHSGSRMWWVDEQIGPRDLDAYCGRVAWCEVTAPAWGDDA